ncbi:MAG TPA: cysteine--tRNA ligase [Candidatus Paceibacterota bacterium]|nr:cysteine--tRNA ligase [Candidatus Paceibacterota bacterium]
MFIYNTLTGRKEKITKPSGRPLQIFVCGPTVYDWAHIGNARVFLVFDLFVRYLRSRGWNVFYLQNITDIDDKIIDRARREGKKPAAVAALFEKRYREDMKKLDISSVDHYARATAFIPEIVRQIRILEEKGYAYRAGDGYYFDIKRFKDYGKLSHRTALQADDAVSRIDQGADKRNKGDFALWKFVDEGSKTEPGWETPFGYGRPGWHIEDTAITEKFFGPQYDIHGGAADLKFPHHEAEIAQQEAASGKKPFVKTWMHVGFLLVGGKKMSKSLGNLVTIREFLKKHPPELLRFMFLSNHYRTPFNFTEKLTDQCLAALDSFAAFLDKMAFVAKKSKKTGNDLHTARVVKETESRFHGALEDDFNTPGSLAEISKFVSEMQKTAFQLSPQDARAAAGFVEKSLSVFGLKLKTPPIPPKIKAEIAKRDLLRRREQFAQADALRKKIWALGYDLEDTPLGTFVRRRFS